MDGVWGKSQNLSFGFPLIRCNKQIRVAQILDEGSSSLGCVHMVRELLRATSSGLVNLLSCRPKKGLRKEFASQSRTSLLLLKTVVSDPACIAHVSFFQAARLV